jgi:hypothetical protein
VVFREITRLCKKCSGWDECDDDNKVKEIFEEIDAGVDLDEITVKRFNSSKNTKYM